MWILYEDHALVTELWKFVGPQNENYQPEKKKKKAGKMRNGRKKTAWERPDTFFCTSGLVEKLGKCNIMQIVHVSNKRQANVSLEYWP